MTSANKNIVPFPQGRDRRTEFEVAFLPAALEVMERPPSPTKRVLGAIIIALFCIALGWASIGSVDIIAISQGKIVPSGRTKLVQPFETGVVRAIHVRDGQNVKAGEVLIELDPTMTAADVQHLKADLSTMQLYVARLRAALSDSEDALDSFKPPAGADPALVEMNRQFLVSQVSEQRSKIAELERQRLQKAAERDTVAAGISKIEGAIPILKERLGIRKYLYESELGSKITYLSDLQELTGQQNDLLVQQSKLREAEAATAVLSETKAKVTAEYRHKLYSDLAEAEQKAAGLSQDVIKAEKRANLQFLTAPVDGVVQQLSVHTIGGVVTPAQSLAVVVPFDTRLEIEAMVSNRDIGFVTVGQDVQVKIDTFTFTRYGLLKGKVLSVSGDAIPRNKPPEGNSADAAKGLDTSTSEPKGQELVYSARISLDRTQMQVDDKIVNLSPGMAVTAEIVTGRRRIISYLLSPVMKYSHDVLRER
jgi:hemolysin D